METTELSGPLVRAMDVSTAHMPETSPDFGDLRCLDYDCGYMVFVPGSDAKEAGSDIPDWILPLLEYAWSHDCMFLNFHSDADQFDQFPKYDW